jgi:hypothetical protein
MRLLVSALAFLFAAFLVACAPKPPDVPACESLEQYLAIDSETQHLILKPSPTCAKQIGEFECGHCVYIVSGKEIFIGEGKAYQLNGKPWSQIKHEAVLLPAVESYAPLAAYVINACKKMHCSDDIARFKIKLDSLSGVTAAIPNPSPSPSASPSPSPSAKPSLSPSPSPSVSPPHH